VGSATDVGTVDVAGRGPAIDGAVVRTIAERARAFAEPARGLAKWFARRLAQRLARQPGPVAKPFLTAPANRFALLATGPHQTRPRGATAHRKMVLRPVAEWAISEVPRLDWPTQHPTSLGAALRNGVSPEEDAIADA
jgi:hypothetical protein